MQTVVRDEAALTTAERAARTDLWERIWPPSPGEVPDPNYVDPRVATILLLAENGALAGACQLLERTVTIDGEPDHVAGLVGVVVVEPYRCAGHGSSMVQAAGRGGSIHGHCARLWEHGWK